MIYLLFILGWVLFAVGGIVIHLLTEPKHRRRLELGQAVICLVLGPFLLPLAIALYLAGDNLEKVIWEQK